jgi:N-acetylmuramoyl-L-alanine amidase
VELHFNAAVASNATGTGVLYHPRSTRGRAWAGLLQSGMTAALGLPPWPEGTDGVITPFRASGREMRGQKSLSAGQAPAALIEPFFGSNPADAARAAAAKGALALAIVRAAERWPG